jgi:dihydroorotase-like cyclic amidohydrolase
MRTQDLHRHTDWCASNHSCHLGEHRAEPITRTLPGMGTFTLTRVQAVNGREHAEIRISIPLAAGTTAARAHLAHLLRLLHAFTRRAPLPR